jgi:hypothetical protein
MALIPADIGILYRWDFQVHIISEGWDSDFRGMKCRFKPVFIYIGT